MFLWINRQLYLNCYQNEREKKGKKKTHSFWALEVSWNIYFCKGGKTSGCQLIIRRGPTGTSSSQDLFPLITEDVRGQTQCTIKAGYCRRGNRSHNGKMFLSHPYLLPRHETTAGNSARHLRKYLSSKHTYTSRLKKDRCKRQKNKVSININHKTGSIQIILRVSNLRFSCGNATDRFLWRLKHS